MTEGWCTVSGVPKLECWCSDCMGPYPVGVDEGYARAEYDLADVGLEVITVPQYKDMTREELIEALEAHDAHHQIHHQLEELLVITLRAAKSAIKGREHTGFIDKALALVQQGETP